MAQGKESGTKHAPASDTKDIPLDERPGYTGTAHALLQSGVPSVVAMRYAVGDDYARELAVEFYRALLAHAQPKSVAAALTMARQSLLDPHRHDRARYDVCDHATPVLYGAEQPDLTVQRGRSPGLDTRNPRLHQIAELTTAGHAHFVGRTWELAGLGADFIGSSSGEEVKPVALITGLGGMGKTALTAEALALWESRFEWVLLYRAKPNALGFDTTLRDIHLKLNAELGRYHAHVQARPADAIYRAAEAVFDALQHQNMTAALQAGSRALVYCVQAGAYDRLGGFASRLVTSTSDPRLLAGLLPHLEAAAESAPEGEPRWRCLGYLADALRRGGRPDASLPFYEQVATLARTAAEAEGENGRQAWAVFT